MLCEIVCIGGVVTNYNKFTAQWERHEISYTYAPMHQHFIPTDAKSVFNIFVKNGIIYFIIFSAALLLSQLLT